MYFHIFISNCNHLADILLLLFSDLRVTVLIISAILGVYWIFYVPCNWTKSLQSVGYMPAVNSINFWKRINSCKQHSINGFRRPRLIGITELPPPYPNGWYCILESSSLIAKNVTYVSCLGEHFVVFRTFDGQVNVLDAYCPHLGANMGLNGQVKGDNIECPFHQWSFRGSDGTCANIPYSHTAWITDHLQGERNVAEDSTE
ncbi:unnamed protein product [Ceratitis capitata]|uniref:(Mediterranean fruit fly) hypothetical protein n=1 Tax=Ceratitis capitata TaxID=7213 RepID=A0A811UD98_CERCA|nr:unnamed protein product [Ceratitis capitata]